MTTAPHTIAPPCEDLTGRVFGKRTVIAYSGRSGGKQPVHTWLCRCQCGREKIVRGYTLLRGESGSCGICDRSGRRIDRVGMIGRRFHRWTVLSSAGFEKRAKDLWNCRCDCGTDRVATGHNLRGGIHQSCGCQRAESVRASSAYGGASGRGDPRYETYWIWHGMRCRCRPSPGGGNHNRYHHGRGIRVCERWQSFDNFIADMGLKPTGRMSLDRIDVNGHYEPGNCRWADDKTQARNRTSNVLIEVGGRKMCLSDWADVIGISPNLIMVRWRNARRRAAGSKSERQECKAFRRQLMSFDFVPCRWCGELTVRSHRETDHIVPLKRGGRERVDNLCCSCQSCNARKGSKVPSGYSADSAFAEQTSAAAELHVRQFIAWALVRPAGTSTADFHKQGRVPRTLKSPRNPNGRWAFSKAESRGIAKAYVAGESMQAIASRLGCKDATIRNALRRAAQPVRSLSEARKLADHAKASNLPGLSSREVAVRLGVTQSMVNHLVVTGQLAATRYDKWNIFTEADVAACEQVRQRPDEDGRIALAERVQASRQALGLSPELFGHRLGVGGNTIRRIERCERLPQAATLARLTAALPVLGRATA